MVAHSPAVLGKQADHECGVALVDLSAKAQDIDLTLNNIFGAEDLEEVKRKRDYSARAWSGIRTIFRAADMFNRRVRRTLHVLTNQTWFGASETLWKVWRRLSDPFGRRRRRVRTRRIRPHRVAFDQRALRTGRARLMTVGRRKPATDRVKTFLARVATDPGEWLRAYVAFLLTATLVKVVAEVTRMYLSPEKDANLGALMSEPRRLIIASLTSEFDAPHAGQMEMYFMAFQILFLAVNTLFMAFLIAMMVRYVTRD